MRMTWWRAIVLVFALPSLLDLGTGCDRVFGLDSREPPGPQQNAHTCQCTCFQGTGDQISRDFNTCLPAAFNPNLGGAVATQTDMTNDCGGRVRPTFLAILHQCATSRIKRKLELEGDGACVCDSFFDLRFVDICNGDCVSMPLLTDCTNEQTATSVAGLDPVCLAEPGATSMGRALFGDRSTCEIEGDITVARGDDRQTRAARGVIELEGAPCPGASCNVGMSYRLDHVDSFGFSSFAGLASVEIKKIQTSGATLSLATLDGFGNGAFGPGSTFTSGRGTRVNEELGGVFSSERTTSYVGSNSEFVDVGVDWAGHQCALSGRLLGASIEDADTDVLVEFTGTILNQPPKANAGGNRSVECTSPAGAPVTLTAGGSDPDGNIVFREWRRGGPGGTEIADPENDGVVQVTQALGSTAVYALNVVDSFMDVSHASAQVSVVDSTAPTITAVSATPNVLSPPNHKMKRVVVGVAVQDTCGAASCSIVSVSSNEPLNGQGDGNTNQDWQIVGPLAVDLRAERAGGGNGRIYTLTVRCGDGTGNASTQTVQVRVPK